MRLGPFGRNSDAILRQASLLPLVSETLSYPPSSLTRLYRRRRSMRRPATLGSRSRSVLAIALVMRLSPLRDADDPPALLVILFQCI